MGSWAPPLRIARRTTRRALGRTVLVAALIGLPVLGASLSALVNRAAFPTGEGLATAEIGRADARLAVSPYRAFGPMMSRPRLDIGEEMPAEGAEKPVRDPAVFDPLPLLPMGTTIARMFRETGMVELRDAQTTSSANVLVGDGRSPLTEGTFRLDSGRMPANADEVAVTPALADKLGLRSGDDVKPGAVLTTAGNQQVQVVGLARPVRSPQSETVLAPPGSPVITPDPAAWAYYVVSLPAGVDADALSDQLHRQGITLLPRANIISPPASDYLGTSSTNAGGVAVMALIIGFGVLEIVLLAGTAFAVGARRQTRELGLVMATGGTPRDVRRIVVLQGLFAGIAGAGAGVLLAFVAAFAGRPLWERLSSTLFVGWEIPWTSIVVTAAIGLGAGLAAAVVPAISASRQPTTAALSGRFAAAGGEVRIRRLTLLLLAAGIASVLVGSGMIASAYAAVRTEAVMPGYQPSVTPTGPIALVLLGITSVIAALVWMLPSLVAKLADVARLLPLSARLALRDAARHRHRTGPATAAIMMAVAATAAASFAVANSIAADAEGYVPRGIDGDVAIAFRGSPGEAQYTPELARKVAALLPTEGAYAIGTVVPPTSKVMAGGYREPLFTAVPVRTGDSLSYNLRVVDPDYVARLEGFGPPAAAALRRGEVVAAQREQVVNGKIALAAGDPYQDQVPADRQLPGTFVGAPPRIDFLWDTALITAETARTLGEVVPFQLQLDLTREPTEEELAAVVRLLGQEDMVHVERGYVSPARLWFLGILGAATVVTLLGVAISVSLSAAEGRADLATLAAVGAPPRRRRGLAAAQAWVLGQLGCLLGVGVGALYGYTSHAAFGSPYFAVPWAELAGIVVGVPLFAGALAWLLTRSKLPMVSRID